MNELEFIVICSYHDAIKFHGVYVPLGEDITKSYEEEAMKHGYQLSHGMCDACYNREIKNLRSVKNEKYKQ